MSRAREKRQRKKRARMIAKYKPACPDCGRFFQVDDHVNQCRFCGYYLCDTCAGITGGHDKKCKPNLGRIAGGKP